MLLNLSNKQNLLDLKKKIANLKYQVYLETLPHNGIFKYRLRKIDKNREISDTPDPVPYREYLEKNSGKLTAVFKNLSGEVLLIIPTKPYASISQFARQGSDREWLALFNKANMCLKKGEYLSTHGHGVAWLHLRIEKFPKYYNW